jgi:3'(2'), 5'-bisphosphate nucleotidase
MSFEKIYQEIKLPTTTSNSPFFEDIQLHLIMFIKLLRDANKIIMENRKPDMHIEWKQEGSRTSPVTQADIKANELICNCINDTFYFEKFVIVSEENKEILFNERNNISLDAIWVIDPLDGTSSYINYDVESASYLDNGFTVNIARLEKRNKYQPDGSIVTFWKPVFGIISTPTDNMVYFGGEGIGSYQFTPDNNLLPIGMNYPKKAEKNFNDILSKRKVRVGISASHCNQKTKDLITTLFDDNYESYSSGSSMKFIDVYLGKTDFYPRLGTTMEWDICAAVAIGESCGFNIKIFDESIKCFSTLNNLTSVVFNKLDLHNPYFIVY